MMATNTNTSKKTLSSKFKQVAQKILNKLRNEELQIKLRQEKTLKIGYDVFLKTGQTPHDAHMANIGLFCATNGVFQEEFNNKLKQTNFPISITDNLNGVAGTYAPSDFIKINNELNEKGYVFFDKKLSQELCE